PVFHSFLLFFTSTPTTDIYTLSLHDALPILLPAQTHSLLHSKDRKARIRSAGQKNCQCGCLHLLRLPTQQVTAQSAFYRQKLSRSEEHTSELQSRENLVCRLLLEKKNKLKKE